MNIKRMTPSCIRWSVILLFPFFYLLCGLHTNGPAYLADEIGYLTKAIFLSGYDVDGASSYYAGYSFLLAPLFKFLPDTSSIWIGAMIVNALLWVSSFYLLDRLVVTLRSDTPETNRILILIFSAAYPSWATMAGYVFPTSAFVTIFLAGLVALARIKNFGCKQTLPFSLLVSLLAWIHPAGLAVAVASVVALSFLAIRTRTWRPLLMHTIISSLLILVYTQGIHPWLADAMTPAGFHSNMHYPGGSKILSRAMLLDYWVVAITRASGQMAYLLVSTFGIAFLGIVNSVYRTKKLMMNNRLEQGDVVRAYTITALFGVIAIGVIGGSPDRVDHWIYGRYLDGVALPVIALGMVSLLEMGRRSRITLLAFAVICVIAAGLLIETQYHPMQPNNLVNTPSFWPQFIFSNVDILKWMIAGAVAIAVVAVGGKFVALLFVVASLFICTVHEIQWHQLILSGHSKPSSIIDLVRHNYPKGNCIGYDPEFPAGSSLMRRERLSLFKYYFFDYNYSRMSAEDWRERCNGPFLTYNPDQFIGKTTERILARSNTTGLFLIVKGAKREIEIPENLYSRGDISFATDMDDRCLIAGCYAIEAEELASFSKVGTIRNGRLSSDGNAGYLFYGPYRNLDKGSYYLILHGNFVNSTADDIDVVSDQGKKTYSTENLNKDDCFSEEIIVPFELKEKVKDLEVRLRVGAEDQVSVSSYKIVTNDGRKLSKSPSLCADGKSLAALPRQVGRVDGAVIKTDGRAGYLLFGPYKRMTAGVYRFLITGEVKGNGENVVVDIDGNRGNKIFARFDGLEGQVNNKTSKNILLEKVITIDETVEDLEVRILVDEQADIFISGYSLRPTATPAAQ